MFTPSNMLLKYMNAQPRDRYDIVCALIGYINADPMFKTDNFDKALQYVLENDVSDGELFEEFDSKYRYEEDTTKWDDDYYSYTLVYLKKNFCRKRIDHVKDVAKKLYPSVTETPKATTNSKKSNQDKRVGDSEKKQSSQQHFAKEQATVPTIVKVATGVGVIVLLALVINQVTH